MDGYSVGNPRGVPTFDSVNADKHFSQAPRIVLAALLLVVGLGVIMASQASTAALAAALLLA